MGDGLAHRLACSLRDGNPELRDDESTLSLFLSDIQRAFNIDDSDWHHMVQRQPGQPFRLELWKFLLKLWGDTDVDLIPQLKLGVRLGVNQTLIPSPIWPLRDADQVADQPLSGQWSGADENPQIASDLLQEEVESGWIEEITGGEDALRKQFPQVASGKLNLVIAPGRSPRLVVDSSVSGVTANTCIPNRMSLPRISDVISAAPDSPTSEACVQLTLDVAKAHRRIKIHPDDGGLLCFHCQKRLFRSESYFFSFGVSNTSGVLLCGLHKAFKLMASR